MHMPPSRLPVVLSSPALFVARCDRCDSVTCLARAGRRAAVRITMHAVPPAARRRSEPAAAGAARRGGNLLERSGLLFTKHSGRAARHRHTAQPAGEPWPGAALGQLRQRGGRSGCCSTYRPSCQPSTRLRTRGKARRRISRACPTNGTRLPLLQASARRRVNGSSVEGADTGGQMARRGWHLWPQCRVPRRKGTVVGLYVELCGGRGPGFLVNTPPTLECPALARACRAWRRGMPTAIICIIKSPKGSRRHRWHRWHRLRQPCGDP